MQFLSRRALSRSPQVSGRRAVATDEAVGAFFTSANAHANSFLFLDFGVPFCASQILVQAQQGGLAHGYKAEKRFGGRGEILLSERRSLPSLSGRNNVPIHA